MKRKVTIDRTDIVSPSRKKRIYHCNGFDNTPSEEVEIRTPYINEHEYESATTPCVSGCAWSEPYIKCSHCFSKKKRIAELLLIIEKQKHSISQLQEKLQKERRKQIFDISDIQHNDKLVKNTLACKMPNFLAGFINSSWWRLTVYIIMTKSQAKKTSFSKIEFKKNIFD